MRIVAIAERRCAALSSAIRVAAPCARPSARSVGRPATRSSSRDCSVVMATSAAADRSAVAKPISTMKIGMSGSAINTISADCQSYSAITAAVAGVRIAARNSDGRYVVKYGRNPSRPRVTTTAASSRCRVSSRGGSEVAVVSTLSARSAITELAPRCASLPCSHCTSVRTVHSANRTPIATQCSFTWAGSVITLATMPARTTAEAMVHAAVSTPHTVLATRKRRIAAEARHSRGSIGARVFSVRTGASTIRWRRVSRRR